MNRKRVLVAPLDWGLGHATRCIPVVDQLLLNHCEVIIAGSGPSLALLKKEYPSLTFVEFPSYNPTYASGQSQVVKMAAQLPKFIKVIWQEHRLTEEVVSQRKIDIVISDNRFGCFSRKAKSIFITHQLNILMPRKLRWLEGLVNYFNHQLIAKYDACWVPDYAAAQNLAGRLSHVKTRKLAIKYIGCLSRFEKCLPNKDFRYEALIVLSGPEPQRTRLEQILVQQLKQTTLKVMMVRGIAGNDKEAAGYPFEVAHFLKSDELNHLVCNSKVVIARSGYSTVMDLAKLEKQAIFIPTPGQTEQMYLAEELRKRNIAYSTPQHLFDLQESLRASVHFTGFKNVPDNHLLKKAIEQLVQ